jgi:hypothetical protein
MMLTPYQHGVVREVRHAGFFDVTNKQFQDEPEAKEQLLELEQLGIIMPSGYVGKYVRGLNHDYWL